MLGIVGLVLLAIIGAGVVLAGGGGDDDSSNAVSDRGTEAEGPTSTDAEASDPAEFTNYLSELARFEEWRQYPSKIIATLGAASPLGANATECATVNAHQEEFEGVNPSTDNAELQRRWAELKQAGAQMIDSYCGREVGSAEDIARDLEERTDFIGLLTTRSLRLSGTTLRTQNPPPLQSSAAIVDRIYPNFDGRVPRNVVDDLAETICVEVVRKGYAGNGDFTQSFIQAFRESLPISGDPDGALHGWSLEVVYDVIEFGAC